jgi:phage N-6-adenine-methyltransferase
MSVLGFKAKNHPQQLQLRGALDDTDDRRTLPDVFDPLHAAHGFTLDVAANEENAKTERYFTLQRSGLKQSWAGEVVWCNPPYSDIRPWVEKALAETRARCPKVVMLLPANRCEQGWWHDLIEPIRDRGLGITTEFLKGRPRFGRPNAPKAKKGDRPPFGLVVVTIEGPGGAR